MCAIEASGSLEKTQPPSKMATRVNMIGEKVVSIPASYQTCPSHMRNIAKTVPTIMPDTVAPIAATAKSRMVMPSIMGMMMGICPRVKGY